MKFKKKENDLSTHTAYDLKHASFLSAGYNGYLFVCERKFYFIEWALKTVFSRVA
jgi:hypothetical protein